MVSFIEEQIGLMHFVVIYKFCVELCVQVSWEHLDLEILLVAFAGLYTRPVMELSGT
jgi:hypothetical protein